MIYILQHIVQKIHIDRLLLSIYIYNIYNYILHLDQPGSQSSMAEVNKVK